MDKTWWCQVTNASNFIKEAIEAVLKENNLVLELPSYLPWYDTMRGLIEEGLRKSSDRILEKINDSNLEPGEMILNQLCKKEVRDEYRPSIGYATFLANCEKTVLNDRFVWVTGIKKGRCTVWLDFVSEYTKKLGNERKGGVFILEIETQSVAINKKRIVVLNFDKKIESCDRLVFNMLAASSVHEKVQMKQYLAELVATIVGNDIELSAQCISAKWYKQFLANPYKALKRVVQEECKSDGSPYVFSMSEEEVNRLIWKAQIKTVFPIVEEYRDRFISKHRNQIEKELPVSNSFGEEYVEPNEVEIGTLYYMTVHGMITLAYEEQKELYRFKEARNKLAHLIVLNVEEIISIFEDLR